MKRLTPTLLLTFLLASSLLADVRPDLDLTKSSTAFKKVFEPIVEKANLSTVQVLCDGHRAILGTIVTADGYILTKASELKGKLTVRLRTGNDLPAKIVGVVPDDDLAMIKIDAKNLTTIEWAAEKESKKTEVGDWVVAAGTGTDRPIAVGIVSVNRRKIPAKAGVLGVQLGDSKDGTGTVVDQVLAESGAEKAGVKVGDIIISVNGKSTKSRADLIDNVRNFTPGDLVTLKVIRAGKIITLTATLGANFTGISPRLDMQNLLLGPVSGRSSAFPVVLQHDTVLKPTDCGGPLLNLDGHTVGLNIARAGRTETYAIPADIIVPLIADLKAGKYAAVSTTAAANKDAGTQPAPATSTAPATKPAAATSPAATANEFVSAWTTTFPLGKDGRLATPDNPEDPYKTYRITYFVNSDGELQFEEFPKRNDGSHAQVAFNFNATKTTYAAFPSPMQVVSAYPDPARKALAQAAVAQILSRERWGVFNRLGLDDATKTTLTKTYGALRESIDLLDADVARGLIEKDQYNTLIAALDDYRASAEADINDNPKKQEAAKKVMQLGLAYCKKIQTAKIEKIDAWVDQALKLLTDDQKKLAADIAKARLEASTRPARTGPI